MASRCRKCLNASRNRNKPSKTHQKRGYCPQCREEHEREWDVAYKRKERGGKPWKPGMGGTPPKWYLAKHPEWRPKTRRERLAYKREYMRKRRAAQK